MDKTCVTSQSDLPEIEPAKTCTCESLIEQLRTDMSVLQEKVHKIEKLLVEKDKILSKMAAEYDSLVQGLDTFQRPSLIEECKSTDINNSESELVEANDEHNAHLKETIQLEEGSREIDHTSLLKTKGKRIHKTETKDGSDIQKRQTKPKHFTEKQATDCSSSKLEETNVSETDTNALSKELSGDGICLHRKIDKTKKKNKGTMLSNVNFIFTMSKEKEKSDSLSRKNKNASDIIRHNNFRPKDETPDSKDQSYGTKLNPMSKKQDFQLAEIKSKPKVNSDMLTDDQRLQTATGHSKCWDIQSNENHKTHSDDGKDEINISSCKQPNDDKQAEKTSEPYFVQSPIESYDKSVSDNTTFDDCPKNKIGFDLISLETSHAFIKTDNEHSAGRITARENTCGTVNEEEMNMQKETVCHPLNDLQHVNLNNPNNNTYILESKIETKTVSNFFDKVGIEDEPVSYDELSRRVSKGTSLTQEFMIQNDDENETSDCKSTDSRSVLSEADSETSHVHHFEAEEIDNIAEMVQNESQPLDNEKACNIFSDKADKDFDLDPHQNSQAKRSNWSDTTYNAEQLLTQETDIDNNANGSETKQDQEMVYDIYIEQTKGCLENSKDVSCETSTKSGESTNAIKTGDERTRSTTVAEQLISPENDLICSKPKPKCPDSYTRAEKETDSILVEPIQEKTKITSYNSDHLKKGAKAEEGPKVWRALADVEQKAARKTLQDLRGAHSVICIDTSVDETASTRINTFVSEFLNGLVEMSGQRELKTEHVALVTFGIETKVQIRFTSDYHRILKCLEHLKFGGPSQIFGGLMMAFAAAHSSRYTHVINDFTPSIYTKIILLTDGRPSYSKSDVTDTGEMDEIKAMILQEMETIRKNCHDLFIVPIGDADIDFLNQMVCIAEGSILDFTSGRQLSRRQFLSMNIKGPVDLKNNLVDDPDGMFTQDDQEDMIDIVEKSKRHLHTRQESRNRRSGGNRTNSKDGNSRFREKRSGGGTSDSMSPGITELLQVLPGWNQMFESDANFQPPKDSDCIPVIIQRAGQSEGVCTLAFCSDRLGSDISKYFEGLSSEGYLLDTSAKEKQPAANQKKKTSERHHKNKNKSINFS